ncbi:MAG: hypothetical protein ACRDX8_13805, partial [Acidimicrobiales bacterium]
SKGGLKTGWTVQIADGSETSFVVGNVIYGNDPANPTTNGSGHYIVGCTTEDVAVAGLAASTQLVWDPLEEGNHGHRRLGFYNPPAAGKTDDPKAGWAVADIAADANGDPTKAFIVYPDGSTGQGQVALTNAGGQSQQVAALAVEGSEFAKGLEVSGAILFDAGEYDSTTQQAETWNPASMINAWTPGFYSDQGAAGSVFWGSVTGDGTPGDADALLCLSASSGQSVRWWDNQILEEDGHTRSYEVTHDVTLQVPIYVAAGGPLLLGSHATIESVSGETITILEDPAVVGIAAGQQWTLSPGTINATTITVAFVNESAHTVTSSGAISGTHVNGDLLLQVTTATGTLVNTGLLDGTAKIDDPTSAVAAVVVGFRNLDGTWHRGFWGNQSWVCPWGNPMWLGNLPGTVSDWTRLSCKCSDLGIWYPGHPTVHLVGTELGIYAGGSSAAAVYFDAHSSGSSTSRDKTASGTVTSNKVGIGAIKQRHKAPKQNSDAHTHSDLHYWVDSSNMLH